MAATQAEKQQNDVNSEKVQPDEHINVRNSLLQNGTDKSGVRASGSVVISKAKNTGGKNLAIEMSQYRQDGNSGGPTAIPAHNTSGGPTQPGGPCVSDTNETDTAASGATPSAGESGPFSNEGPPSGDGYGFPYSRDGLHNSGEGLHAFGPRHSFGGPKQQPSPNFSQSPQTHFVSGQALSQQTGPTPTLNQLLQSSNPMPHRYQNSYDQSYNQGWSQKPMGPYSGAPSLAPTGTPAYRTQATLSSPYGGSTPSSGYGDSGRAGWSGHSVSSQHPPSSPGPPNSATTPASQPSPQPAAPSHSPGPGSGMPPSPQHQGFPSRPAQPTTPNAHGPDPADLSGGNSNDSSGGPIPGTPNSQGMRPTPSPTGSTGSRSMSPAVGQQNIPMPPRPSSGPSDSGTATRISHSPIGTAPGSYPTTHPAPHSSHTPHGYKTHPGMTPSASPSAQQMSLYQPNQQYPQGAYPARSQQYPSQGYGPPVSQASPSNSMPPQQFQNRQSNHMTNSQFPPYQQVWPTPPPGSKGNGPPQAPTSPRPPHYLKHHLQHKMGFGSISGTPPSPGPPQNYHMGPPPPGHHHSGMGPPNNPSMGPPNIPPSGNQGMPNSHSQHDGPMPPPSSTPNSHSIPPDMMDNGITTTAQSGMGSHLSTSSAGSVTSVVTTGPDGAPIDEGSQQSTLSNASAASGEDPQCTTPKSGRKNDMAGHYSHPTTPQSTVPSPGGAAMNSMHEDYSGISSPSWPRTPASPVFNSHVPPQDTYRSKKTDSLGKLYEMDDSPDRRGWLDKLLAFMDERRTPITTCPTISKNPLDLFRLYVFVKDRGGFMEVTKNKTWKDIAGMLGIGASSSAAYTLRKHYTKNLLAYECQFDRDGIDPQPIINQVEASSKKKSAKAASVPSPGSSNSQDSFPPPGSGGGSMDGYGYGYPPGPNQEYQGQRPSSQANAPSPHGGSGNVNHLNNSGAPGGPSPAGGAGDNVNVSNPFDDVSPSPPPRGGSFAGSQHPPYPAGASPRQQSQNYTGGQGAAVPGGAPSDQYSQYSPSSGYPPVRPVYPPYSGGESGGPPPSPGNSQTPPSGSSQDHYNRYGIGNPPSSGYQPRPAYGATPNSGGPPSSQPAAGSYAPQQEFYRPDQPGAPNSSSFQQPKNMPPPGPQPPRRHPDFAKDQQSYTQYGQNRPQMYNWSNNNQFRPTQYGGSGGLPSQQWQGGRPSGQWDRYPPPNQPYPAGPPGQQQWNAMSGQVPGQSPPLRTSMGPRSGKPFSPPMMTSKGSQQQSQMGSSYTPSQVPKREITFPPDSVEATAPVVYRRKKLCKQDLGPVDAWRIMMSLRSGLLAESTFAIDMLNILLYDDSSIPYFGLNQWPSLLDLLLEHFRKGLSDIFDYPFPKPECENPEEPDLGGVVEPIDPDKKTVLLKETNNYSAISRKGDPVKIEMSDDLFIRDDRKLWDIHGDAHESDLMKVVESDPWRIYADHLLPPFQAEFGRIPFHMKLKDEEIKKEEETYRPRTPPPDEAPPPTFKPERKRRTKTLNDVISRIKKDSNNTSIISTEESEAINTETIENVTKTDEVECEKASIDLSVSVNGELRSNENSENEKGEPKVREPCNTFKRRRTSDFEDEAYTRDESSLVLLTESQDNLGKRCVCMSNIIRSLTFVPGNELEFSKNSTFLKLAGKILLLHHSHPQRTQKTRNYDREEDADFGDSCSSLQGEAEWWWDFLQQIRENILVAVANIAGQIDVSQFSEEIARPLLDGLLHWAICPSATGQDPFPTVGPTSLLSPQRLALEALCKLCVTNCNVDLVIATPPFSRLERLCGVLTKHLCRSEDQVLREFSINLLHYLAAADSSLARVVASQTPCVSLLVAFIEHAEQSALGVANQHGIGALRDNPDSMGTSLDMLRRAAATLVFLAQHPDNRALLVQQEARLLALVMSQILDQQVALLLSKVLFQISRS